MLNNDIVQSTIVIGMITLFGLLFLPLVAKVLAHKSSDQPKE